MPVRSSPPQQPIPMAEVVSNHDPIFVSALDAGRMLGITRAEVYALCDAQQIESRYHGKRRLVVLASLRQFADSLPTERAG
jgi:hypothetical protein